LQQKYIVASPNNVIFPLVIKIQQRGTHFPGGKVGCKGNPDLTPKSNVAGSLRNSEFCPNENELMGKTCDPNFLVLISIRV
jgi:hypothetical protein